MVQDTKLLKAILLYVENNADDINPIDLPDGEEGFSQDRVLAHVRLLEDAGYLELDKDNAPPKIVRLTYEGQKVVSGSLN